MKLTDSGIKLLLSVCSFYHTASFLPHPSNMKKKMVKAQHNATAESQQAMWLQAENVSSCFLSEWGILWGAACAGSLVWSVFRSQTRLFKVQQTDFTQTSLTSRFADMTPVVQWGLTGHNIYIKHLLLPVRGIKAKPFQSGVSESFMRR